MSNLPDDWGAYRRKCNECGHMYHMSGTEECACEPCKTEDCWTLAVTEDGYCHSCDEVKDYEQCPQCGEMHPKDRVTHNEQDEVRCFDCLDEETKEVGDE